MRMKPEDNRAEVGLCVVSGILFTAIGGLVGGLSIGSMGTGGDMPSWPALLLGVLAVVQLVCATALTEGR